MFKTETEVINWLYSFSPSKSGRSLDHLHDMLARLDNPHQTFKTIHIAGTNGKGSTVAYLREALMQSGYKVATFTSPYITCFGERMSINNMPIAEVDLIKYANLLKNELPELTSAYASFDLITLISFLYFADANVDFAIYETGIGGRLDATNVIVPLATAITNVGHDHAEVLGETQLERLKEKLGIVKTGIPLFTTEEDPALRAEIKKVCQEKKVALFFPLEESQLKSIGLDGTRFRCRNYLVKIKMQGRHQFKNAVLAVSILDYLKHTLRFSDINPRRMTNATWQGRFEHVQQTPPVVLDGAHNLEGIQSLMDVVERLYPKHHKKFLFSSIATKESEEMVLLLQEVATETIFTKGTHPHSVSPEVLAAYKGGVPSLTYHDYKKAIDSEIDKLKAHEVLIICGSLYFISDARNYLLEQRRFSN